MNIYPNLSRPIQIGKVTIKNRMFMAPMDTGFGLLFSDGTSTDNQDWQITKALVQKRLSLWATAL